MATGAPAPSGPSGAERQEALQYAAATRRFLERRGRRVKEPARSQALAAAAALEAAVAAGDVGAIATCTAQLDALWHDHLALAARKRFARELLDSAALALLVALLIRLFVAEPFKIPSASMAPSLLVGDHIIVSKVAYGVRVPSVNRWLVRWAEPRRGDVIVFASPRQPGRDYVKRIVGLPGDVVELRDQVVYVNGVPQPRQRVGPFTYQERSESDGRWLEDTCVAWREELARGRLEAPRAGGDADLAEAWAAAAARGTAAHDVVHCRRPRIGEREGPFERVRPGHVFVLGDNRDRSADSRSDGGWQVPLENVKGRAMLVWWSWGKSGWFPWRRADGLRTDRLFKRIE